MLIRKKIKLESLNINIRFYITDDVKETVKSLKRLKVYNLREDEAVQGFTGREIVNDKAIFYLVLVLDKNLTVTLKTLVHELFHATQDSLEFAEIKFKKGDANETYAYTLDYLFGVTYEHVVKAWIDKYGK